MNAAARLGLYGAGLVAAFAAAFGIAGAVVPDDAVTAWQQRGAQQDTQHGTQQSEMNEHGAGTDAMSSQELENPGPAPLPVGSAVVLRADHMAGMNGAAATIAGSTDETVYMVDLEAGGMRMTNHKWVVESEIRPAE